MNEDTKRPSRNRRLMTGVSLISVLLISSLILVILFRYTRYLAFISIAWSIGLSLGFLMIALRPTESMEFRYGYYWYARGVLVLTCAFIAISSIIIETYVVSQLPGLDWSIMVFAALVASAVGAAVHYLGKRSF